MTLFDLLSARLGSLTWPLLLTLLVALVILSERLLVMARELLSRRLPVAELLASHRHDRAQLLAELSGQRSLQARGLALLLRQANQPRAVREEVANLWLHERQCELQRGLKLLMLIAVASPLLGLLGTVIGLLQMFDGLATASGGITPAALAGGLGLAMNTTAAGLLIALPALTAAHLLGQWSERRCALLGHLLSHFNLWLDGIHSQEQPLPGAASHHQMLAEQAP